MEWHEKLKQLQISRQFTADGLASALGITTRTLADFMKPADQGGREPTGPVQRLIGHLLGEDESSALAKHELNLVIIHGDFRVHEDQDAVSIVIDMHSAYGTYPNNEYHYVTVEPRRDAKWAFEGLSRRRIQPHFFACEDGADTQEAKDCYFTITAAWLATQAMRRDLAHITLAADPRKFWPLARELKELAEVKVTFVRETASNRDESIAQLLQNIGVGIVDPTGRRLGVISTLKPDFGFITPGRMDADGSLILSSTEKPIFFSWNHMRKDGKGINEADINSLHEGDYVSFSMSMNHRGPCAADVALVKREKASQEVIESKTLTNQPPSSLKESDLIKIIKDAIDVCADEDGWALSSAVGSRVNIFYPDFKKYLLEANPNYLKLSNLAAAHPEYFEVSPNGAGTQHLAACMRIKPK